MSFSFPESIQADFTHTVRTLHDDRILVDIATHWARKVLLGKTTLGGHFCEVTPGLCGYSFYTVSILIFCATKTLVRARGENDEEELRTTD